MKIKNIILTGIFLILFPATYAQAASTQIGSPKDICGVLTTRGYAWLGDAYTTECEYDHTGMVVDSSFHASVVFNGPIGPSRLCPLVYPPVIAQMTCNNGQISINDQGLNLQGALNSDGTAINLTGTMMLNGKQTTVKRITLNLHFSKSGNEDTA